MGAGVRVAKVQEWFGHAPDSAEAYAQYSDGEMCPFIESTCTKTFNDSSVAGACTIHQQKNGHVICCPNRLYAGSYRMLRDVADSAFDPGLNMVTANDLATHTARRERGVIAVFGKGWGGELRLPQRTGVGAYFVDWVLARLDDRGQLVDFVAVEVQTIDTTGSYKDGVEALRAQKPMPSVTVGLNWENVNKRILPQIIYKGHVLRGEPLCMKGLYFITPTPVYKKIMDRLGGTLKSYAAQPGAVTFMHYDFDLASPDRPRPIVLKGSLTTTVDQVALAFTAPANLPPNGVYEDAIRDTLGVRAAAASSAAGMAASPPSDYDGDS